MLKKYMNNNLKEYIKEVKKSRKIWRRKTNGKSKDYQHPETFSQYAKKRSECPVCPVVSFKA